MHFSKEIMNRAMIKNFIRKHSSSMLEDTDNNTRFSCEYIEENDETVSIFFNIERNYLFIDMYICSFKEECFELCSAMAKKVEVQTSPIHFLFNNKIYLRFPLEFEHLNEKRLDASVKKLFKLKHCLISPFEKAANNRLLSLDDIARIECGCLIDFEEEDDEEEKNFESTSDHEFENNDLNELKKTAEEITADIDDDDDILDPSSLGPNPFRFPFFENIARMNADRKANAIFDELESELTTNQEV